MCHWCYIYLFSHYSFFSIIFSRLVCLSAHSSPTAIGIFFLSLDARVRGTGDVVNSLKSEGAWEWEEGGGVWRDTMTFLVLSDGGTSPAFSHRIDSEQTATVQNLNG